MGLKEGLRLMIDLNFYKNKSVFITGHTGFKGAWLSYILKKAKANITGYALDPTSNCVYDLAKIGNGIDSTIKDIRDGQALFRAFEKAKPEIVFHLAAQPLVMDSYSQPAYTFETNVMGTVNILECVRKSESVRSVVVITTDKVYKNNEWIYGYRETDALGGADPYSASKACAEMVAESYIRSFFVEKNIPVTTARAGNVIGGGDISANRIIPDCVRAAVKGEPIIIRNPHSIRPYQHVLEPLFAYLTLAERQYNSTDIAGNYNIGPNDMDCITTGAFADIFCKAWGHVPGWKQNEVDVSLRETNVLRLDSSKLRFTLGLKPVWNASEAISKVVEWEKSRQNGKDVRLVMDSQIQEYLLVSTGS